MESAKELQGRILLVDDESAILRTFRYCLEDEGYTVATANSAAQADTLMQRQVFDLCFLDLRLGEDNGLDVLAQMRIQAPWMRVVIVTAHSAVDTAVDAIQAGAADYLVKPCSPDQLRLATAKQLEVRQLSARLEALEGAVRQPKDGLDSHSPSMMVVLETARQVAGTDANILILGESGTGKGELARAIHGWSKRSKKSCVTINCPSLTAELMESELFGHSRGRLPVPVKAPWAASTRQTAARCFSTRSAISPSPCNPNCCVLSRTRNTSAWATRSPAVPTCGSWRPPT